MRSEIRLLSRAGRCFILPSANAKLFAHNLATFKSFDYDARYTTAIFTLPSLRTALMSERSFFTASHEFLIYFLFALN